MIGTIISLVAGALGGNLAGALMKKTSLGTLWNSVAGIVGGGLGGTILGYLGMGEAAGGDAMEIGNLLSTVAGGGVGGGVLMAIIGLIRGAMAK